MEELFPEELKRDICLAPPFPTKAYYERQIFLPDTVTPYFLECAEAFTKSLLLSGRSRRGSLS